MKWSYFVPMSRGIAVLLKPLPWRYHSLIELRVLLRVRSNMNSSATASLQTRGSMLTNSRWPPKSQIENVISVLRIEIVFSMKLTPRSISRLFLEQYDTSHTKCLNIILIPATLHIFYHQTGFPYLCITNHPHLDDDTALSPPCIMV